MDQRQHIAAETTCVRHQDTQRGLRGNHRIGGGPTQKQHFLTSRNRQWVRRGHPAEPASQHRPHG
jgi:hypothetical protein